MIIISLKVSEHYLIFRQSSYTISNFASFLKRGKIFKGKHLLLQEQMLSFKCRPDIGKSTSLFLCVKMPEETFNWSHTPSEICLFKAGLLSTCTSKQYLKISCKTDQIPSAECECYSYVQLISKRRYRTQQNRYFRELPT